MATALNNDMALFGLTVECIDFYEAIFDPYKLHTLIFRRAKKVALFSKEADFHNYLKKLGRFDENKIKSNLKKSFHEESMPYYRLGSYTE